MSEPKGAPPAATPVVSSATPGAAGVTPDTTPAASPRPMSPSVPGAADEDRDIRVNDKMLCVYPDDHQARL